MSESTTEQLKEKAQALEEILIDVQKDLAVSKDQAVAIESFAPGLLPREASVQSFTEIPSKTNLSATTQALTEGVRQSVGEAFQQLAARAEQLSLDFPPAHPDIPVTSIWDSARDTIRILEAIVQLSERFPAGNPTHTSFLNAYREYTTTLLSVAPEVIKSYYTDTGLRQYIVNTSSAAEGYIVGTKTKAEQITEVFNGTNTDAKKLKWNVLPLIVKAISDFCFPISATGSIGMGYPLNIEAEVSEAVLAYVDRMAAKQGECSSHFALMDYASKRHILQEFGALYDRRYLVKEAAEATYGCAIAAGNLNPAKVSTEHAFNMHAAMDNNWRYMGHTGTLMQTVIEAETEFAKYVVRTAYPLVQKAADIYFVTATVLPEEGQLEGMKQLIAKTLPLLEQKYSSSYL